MADEVEDGTWVALDSSMASSAKYEQGHLFVHYKKNNFTAKYAVKRELFEGLISAPSAGRYINAHIFNLKYTEA